MEHEETNIPTDISYQFFASISTKDRAYLCDFHKVSFADGAIQYKVFLQTLNHKDIVADMTLTPNEGWRIRHSSEPIAADVEWKLISEIVKNAAR